MTNLRHRLMLGVLGCLLLTPGVLPGQQLNVALNFDTAQSLLDEHGQLLAGNDDQRGALIQILAAGSGVQPPDVEGHPHANNPVLGEAHIGQGIDPASGETGKASGSVLINRYVAQGIFARVFNRPTLDQASFYTDSQVYTNSTAVYDIFTIQAAQTDKPVDTGDEDGDGLGNSWEESYGADAENPDSDGDGVGDGDEFRAGTGIMDENSFLAMVQVSPQAGGNVLVQWDAVAGKSYQLQFTPSDLGESGQIFSNVNGVVTATGAMSATMVTNGMSFPVGFFRVLLVE